MCVGILPSERVTRAKARGAGPPRRAVRRDDRPRRHRRRIGARQSQELGEEDADKRPSVQVGDPFTGKKLIEASVELVERGLVESLQDCGAAGLASALAEMASDGAGIDVHLDRVPQREEAMEPWEIMISESQERMVAVVRPQMLDAVREVCARWELPCTVIGEVTDGGDAARASTTARRVGEIPARFLTDECPRYDVEQRAAPERGAQRDARARSSRSAGSTSSTTTSSARAPCAGPGSTPPCSGCAPSHARPRRVAPGRRPGRAARSTPARRPCSAPRATSRAPAAQPIGLTDCLNFGNPEKPEIAWELAEAIDGIAAAASALGAPVVSGNVSLYNETDGRAIPPTPVVGCVGLVPDVRRDSRALARR